MTHSQDNKDLEKAMEVAQFRFGLIAPVLRRKR